MLSALIVPAVAPAFFEEEAQDYQQNLIRGAYELSDAAVEEFTPESLEYMAALVEQLRIDLQRCKARGGLHVV